MPDNFLKNKSSIFARKTVKTIARKKWDRCFRSGKINASCMLAGLCANNSFPTLVVILALLSHCSKTRWLLCRLAGKAQRMRRHPTLAVAQARECEATLETCSFLRWQEVAYPNFSTCHRLPRHVPALFELGLIVTELRGTKRIAAACLPGTNGSTNKFLQVQTTLT